MKGKIISLLIIIYLFNIILCQNIFIDYASRGHIFPDNWSYAFDSLRNWGASIFFPSALHEWSPQEIKYCDQVWLIGDTIGSYNIAQKNSLIRHLLNKRKLVLLWVHHPLSRYSFLNEFLIDTTIWKTTAEVCEEHLIPAMYITKMIFNYYNLTDGVDSLYFVSKQAYVECGNNCYPFIFREYHGNPGVPPNFPIDYTNLPLVAVSYPFLDKDDCSYILILTVFHSYENMELDYIDFFGGQNYKLLKNFFFAPCSLDFPCPVPELYKISVTSIPSCANPGDTVRICGRNLWRGKTESLGGDIEIYIGTTEPVPHEYDTIVIPIRYSQNYTGDSTWLEFIMPDLPPGTYPIRLGHKAITFYAGDIMVPCPHRCERFPNPITPNFDAINDFAQFEFDGIFVKPAQIHIFDIHGHEIRTIDVPADFAAKQHARWDSTDEGGNPVPEGVYIYTIKVAGEVVCEGTITVAQ